MTIFSDDFQAKPFWWERTPRPVLATEPLPATAEVLIIGSGYTGLSAAAQTAQHGLHTVVVDTGAIGHGCSTRNGGQVSPSIRWSFVQLRKKYGATRALAILQEGQRALAWVEQVVSEQAIDCDFRRVGRFYGAHSPAALAHLRATIATTPPELGPRATIIPPAEQGAEIASDFYHGGMLQPGHAAIDPARYHQGLVTWATTAGAQIIPHCGVTQLTAARGGWRVVTEQGDIMAKRVVIATSGYTTPVTSWQRRRIIPISSSIIATEPLPPAMARDLIPNQRVITDTLNLVVYYRLCPAGERLLFGGRVAANDNTPRQSAALLRALMLQRFPQLTAVKISHWWSGFVGYTFDHLPHLGRQRGLYYAMGYCGSGVSLASYFGMKVGLKVIGAPTGETALDSLTFPARPYYRYTPWFLTPAIRYYRWRDRRAVAP